MFKVLRLARNRHHLFARRDRVRCIYLNINETPYFLVILLESTVYSIVQSSNFSASR